MKPVFTFLAFCMALAFFYTSAKKSQEYSNVKYTLIEDPPMTGLKPKAIDLFTLGHRGLYDDFLDIWLLQILGDQDLTTGDADELYKTILKVVNQEPKVESLYMLSCFILAMDFERPELCEQITIRGLNLFPQSWRLPMTQGYIYAFKLNDPVKASAFYNLAATRETSPKYVGRLAKKLLLKDGINTETMKETLDLMLNVPGGSRFSDFVGKTINAKKQKKKNEQLKGNEK